MCVLNMALKTPLLLTLFYLYSYCCCDDRDSDNSDNSSDYRIGQQQGDREEAFASKTLPKKTEIAVAKPEQQWRCRHHH